MAVIESLVCDYPFYPSLLRLADAVPVALQRLTGAGLLKATGSGTGVNTYLPFAGGRGSTRGWLRKARASSGQRLLKVNHL